MTRRHSALLALLGAAVLGGCASHPPLRHADHVDLGRYMGTWHVISHVPYFAEKGDVASADIYALKPDGTIAVTYRYRKRIDGPDKTWNGKAWLPDPADPAHWKVQLVWPLRSDYVIVDLAADYRSVLVGLPSRKLMWIMARDRQLPEAEYQRLLGVAKAEGFPVDEVRKVPQRAEDIGQPGFEP
ncbi:lipocalin family protein [Dyella sp.]|jgi:apolipoprotein D and lipocalin family protein|uniref:lipocalin family protein n=1 Tax=Dyella sp. TaxID=1869338 RepID=UPI002D78E497|nr:lipocalin family protein [Dyella sp.]HET6433988.1 lipocalin family protein [Dyella sp.]